MLESERRQREALDEFKTMLLEELDRRSTRRDDTDTALKQLIPLQDRQLNPVILNYDLWDAHDFPTWFFDTVPPCYARRQ